MSENEASEEELSSSEQGDESEAGEETGEEDGFEEAIITPRSKVSPKKRVHAKSAKPAPRKRKVVEERSSSKAGGKRVAVVSKKKPTSVLIPDDFAEDCIDFSRPTIRYCRDKCKLGLRYYANIEECSFVGDAGKKHRFEALVLTRLPTPTEGDVEAKKEFRFNIPASLITPLRDSLSLLISKSKLPPPSSP